MSPNICFFGKSCDYNTGNGKTLSAVAYIVDALNRNPERRVFSNIRLNFPYTKISPNNFMKVLDIYDSIVLLDEIHTVIHKNHRINEFCKYHTKKGLCYDIIEFARQTRKRNIDFLVTCQDFFDIQYQLRTVMHQLTLCEKYHLTNSKSIEKCTRDTCLQEHVHYILNVDMHSGYEKYIFAEPYYELYDTYEVVPAWNSIK